MRTKRLLLVFLIVAHLANSALGQETVYVAPIPSPGDPNYFTYQLQQLGSALRRNEMESVRLEAFRARAEVDKALVAELERSELESLLSLAQLLESSATDAQRNALRQTIQEKLDKLLPARLRSWDEGTLLVVATPGFSWAAEQVAGVLDSQAVALETGLYEAKKIAREDPAVIGLVEVQVNVYQAYETVKALCYSADGKLVWEKKRVLNSGGGPETLARGMVGALLKKVRGKSCPE